MDGYDNVSHSVWDRQVPRGVHPELPEEGAARGTAPADGRHVSGLGLQLQDVSLERREIRVARAISGGRVETPKSGKARKVDMSLALKETLERHDAASKAAALRAGKERTSDARIFRPWTARCSIARMSR